MQSSRVTSVIYEEIKQKVCDAATTWGAICLFHILGTEKKYPEGLYRCAALRQ